MPDEFPPTLDRRSDDARPSSGSLPTERDSPSRRSFLASVGSATAGLAATAGLGATAGCVELLPSMGQAARYEDVAMPEAPPPRYREWVPASDDGPLDNEVGTVAIPNNDSEAVLGFSFDYGTGWISPVVDYFGVGIRNYDLAFTLQGGLNNVAVLEGPVAPQEVQTTVLDSGYEAADPLAEYDRYVREDVPRTVAVTDGRIIFGMGPERDAAIQQALDASGGRITRATEHPAFERVTDEARLRPFVWVGDRFGGFFDDYRIDRYAVCMDYDEDGIVHAMYVVFDDETPSEAEIREEIEADEIGKSASVIEVSREDGFGSFEARVPLDVAKSDFQEAAGIPPQITWGVERPDDSILLRHDAGDAVPAADLVVAVGYEDGGRVQADVQFTDRYQTVGPGATIEVPTDEIPQDEELTIWYVTDGTEMTIFDVEP